MGDLIRFVFANSDDTYYRDDLLTANLNQQLWLKLHYEHFSCVYYLSANKDGNSFNVVSFGDKGGKMPEKCENVFISVIKRLGNSENELGKWIIEQLRDWNDPAAFVCSLADFCMVCEKESWRETLKELASDRKRRGVLVLTVPTAVEESKNLLLKSKVFNHLNEDVITVLRSGKECSDMYEYIVRNKGDGCVFMNRFSRDSVYPIVLRAMFKNQSRFLDESKLERVTLFLTAYLNNPCMHRDNPLFEWKLPTEYMLFRDLYERLGDDSVWYRVIEASKECTTMLSAVEQTKPILTRQNNIAMKLMRQQVSAEMRALDNGSEKAEEILDQIKNELTAVKNCGENQYVRQKLEVLQNRLYEVEKDDIITFIEVLLAIRYCVRNMYVREYGNENEKVLRLIKAYETGISLAESIYHQHKNSIRNYSANLAGKSSVKAMDRLNTYKAAAEMLLDQYNDLLNRSMIETGMNIIAERLDSVVDEFQKILSMISSGENKSCDEKSGIVKQKPADYNIRKMRLLGEPPM